MRTELRGQFEEDREKRTEKRDGLRRTELGGQSKEDRVKRTE